MDAYLQLYVKYLSQIPAFFLTLGKLFIEPRTFLLNLSGNDDRNLRQSIEFLVLSLIFTLLMVLPFLWPLFAEMSISQRFVIVMSELVLTVIGTAIFGLAIFFGCKLSGGAMSFTKCFTYCNYLTAICHVIIVMFTILTISILMISTTDIYLKIFLPLSVEEFQNYVSIPGTIVGFFSAFIWFTCGWGAFRIANGFSVFRSFIAFGFSLSFVVPVLAGAFVIGFALLVTMLPQSH